MRLPRPRPFRYHGAVLTTSLGRFRLIGLLEGASFLALLLVAMPLKYAMGMPLAVKYTGWAHGVLFMAYLAALLAVWAEHKWSVKKLAFGFLAALLPAGPIVFDRWLQRTEAAEAQSGPGPASPAA